MSHRTVKDPLTEATLRLVKCDPAVLLLNQVQHFDFAPSYSSWFSILSYGIMPEYKEKVYYSLLWNWNDSFSILFGITSYFIIIAFSFQNSIYIIVMPSPSMLTSLQNSMAYCNSRNVLVWRIRLNENKTCSEFSIFLVFYFKENAYFFWIHRSRKSSIEFWSFSRVVK